MRRQVMIVLAMVGIVLVAPAFSQQVTLDPKAYLAKAKPTWDVYDWCSAQSDGALSPEEDKTLKAIRNSVQGEVRDQKVDCEKFWRAASRIERLTLSDKQLKDLGPIAALPQLRRLDLDGNALATLDQIKNLPNLQAIKARKNPVRLCPQFTAKNVDCKVDK
jgi:Leucine-rich repeat (LRR) protein